LSLLCIFNADHDCRLLFLMLAAANLII